MRQFEPAPPRVLPSLGCLALALAVLFLCLTPIVFVNALHAALSRLHLHPAVAVLAVIGMFVGSMINVPVRRIPRDEEQPEIVLGLLHYGMMAPQFRHVRRESVLAVNVGGCVIPSILAAWQMRHVSREGTGPFAGLAIVSAVNIAVCYYAARPAPGIGIIMPAFLSPLVAVGLTWIVCGRVEHVGEANLAPIAFTAGVLGPLVGADLLHLKDALRAPLGMMSIGGAGTFDGIVLSGVLAALLA